MVSEGIAASHAICPASSGESRVRRQLLLRGPHAGEEEEEPRRYGIQGTPRGSEDSWHTPMTPRAGGVIGVR
jgi:hypothetical protein